jgi:hypothetical protein
MRDGCAKLYDAKNEGTKEQFVHWVSDHSEFAYVTIWDAIRACFRKDTKKKANPKPTDLKAFALKILEGIVNKKFDDDEQFSLKEVEEIAMLIGLDEKFGMPQELKDMIAPAPAEEQKAVNQ